MNVEEIGNSAEHQRVASPEFEEAMDRIMESHVHKVRMPDTLWNAVIEEAKLFGVIPQVIIRDAITYYLDRDKS